MSEGATPPVEMLPNHERRILEAHVRGVSLRKLDLQEKPLNEYERDELKRLVLLRMKGFPLQYLLCSQAFYGRDFYVNTTVLIPRPETEGLVELALKHLPAKQSLYRPVALDFGTGSGCIALTLALERSDLIVYAAEASEEAGAVAEENGRRFKVPNVDFFRVSETPHLWQYDDVPELDLLISNPPYLIYSEEIPAEVRDHEPHQALFVPDGDPMFFYRFLAELFGKKAKQSGVGVFEIDDTRGEETANVFRQAGFIAEVLKDLAGRDRYVFVKREG